MSLERRAGHLPSQFSRPRHERLVQCRLHGGSAARDLQSLMRRLAGAAAETAVATPARSARAGGHGSLLHTPGARSPRPIRPRSHVRVAQESAALAGFGLSSESGEKGALGGSSFLIGFRWCTGDVEQDASGGARIQAMPIFHIIHARHASALAIAECESVAALVAAHAPGVEQPPPPWLALVGLPRCTLHAARAGPSDAAAQLSSMWANLAPTWPPNSRVSFDHHGPAPAVAPQPRGSSPRACRAPGSTLAAPQSPRRRRPRRPRTSSRRSPCATLHRNWYGAPCQRSTLARRCDSTARAQSVPSQLLAAISRLWAQSAKAYAGALQTQVCAPARIALFPAHRSRRWAAGPPRGSRAVRAHALREHVHPSGARAR
jgi:hypothetical protein